MSVLLCLSILSICASLSIWTRAGPTGLTVCVWHSSSFAVSYFWSSHACIVWLPDILIISGGGHFIWFLNKTADHRWIIFILVHKAWPFWTAIQIFSPFFGTQSFPVLQTKRLLNTNTFEVNAQVRVNSSFSSVNKHSGNLTRAKTVVVCNAFITDWTYAAIVTTIYHCLVAKQDPWLSSVGDLTVPFSFHSHSLLTAVKIGRSHII